MGEEKSSVKLHGMWASPYVMRAKLGLKIKGIEYEYIEEDLTNKSELLLQYNPVYKKVPVLVHNGLPITESSVILEYIDEVWTHPPYLFPKDPYLKAKHRFWVTYLQQVSEILGESLMTKGKATEEKLNEFWSKLDVAEELIKEVLPNNAIPSFKDGNKPGYLDIMIYSFFGTSDIAVNFFGIELFTAVRYPLLAAWTKAVSEVPEVKDVTPDKAKLIELLQNMRQKFLQLKD